jgi:hypothetical protein
VVIADGADPEKVFGAPGYNVDHENGCKFDNRHDNLRVVSASEHGAKDAPKTGGAYTHEDVLQIIEFFVNPPTARE